MRKILKIIMDWWMGSPIINLNENDITDFDHRPIVPNEEGEYWEYEL